MSRDVNSCLKDDTLHVLRNPYGHSEDEIRTARCDAADEIERLQRQLHNGAGGVKETCATCHGTGKCDDADLGDIYYNEWPCPNCAGAQ
jgi:DnaJ-class molecular chaperone